MNRTDCTHAAASFAAALLSEKEASMSLSIGIVGLPNVGKSTLFTALTNKGGLAANYPFATIEPNVGIVPVPDARLDALARSTIRPRSFPRRWSSSTSQAWCEGASKGEGLGNQFLANIREADAICEVVRSFSDPDVVHVERQGQPGLRRGDHQDRAHPGRHRHARQGHPAPRERGQARQSRCEEAQGRQEGARGLERGPSRPHARLGRGRAGGGSTTCICSP